MEKFSIDKLGVLIGLEIHQQLATNKKLFCNCTPIELDEYPIKFHRKLRASKSELGEFDPAAKFENTKSKTIMYYANPQSSCMVEQDEEPPHELDKDALETALIIATTLNSRIFSEVYPMRKTVIDGSNTTGFQRTMLISDGGFFEVEGKRIGIQSICLEEDAAKILGEKDSVKKYSLERLGVPLVEIATEPFQVDLSQVKEIALSLGRILRSTRKVKRGLGSIRQDVNISIEGGKVVIEVKGVQQLDQLEKVVEYEAKRQHGLLEISEKIKNSNWDQNTSKKENITHLFSKCNSKIIQNALKKENEIYAISFQNMANIFGYSPHEDIRLGKEIAELVRFFGIGGVFHSDELPNYGIEEQDVKKVREELALSNNDAFLILASPKDKTQIVIEQIISRVDHIKEKGIPRDTRLATPDGKTKFLRPRPGSARMYPETDVPPIIISNKELEELGGKIPKSWDESILDLQKKYSLNNQLSVQIFDSEYGDLFEKIVENTKVNPTFVASVLCSSITSLERKGLDSKLLKKEEILKMFEMLESEKIAKESIEIILEEIMSGKSHTLADAIKNSGIETTSIADVEQIIETIVEKNQHIVNKQKERAIGPLMGIAMKELRGKASGESINKILLQAIKKKMQ